MLTTLPPSTISTCDECGKAGALQTESGCLCMGCFGKALDDTATMMTERGKELQARLRENKKTIAEVKNNRFNQQFT